MLVAILFNVLSVFCTTAAARALIMGLTRLHAYGLASDERFFASVVFPSRTRDRAGVRGSYAGELGRTNQTVGVEVDIGAGISSGTVPRFLQYFGNRPQKEFLFTSPFVDGFEDIPIGPTLRGGGQDQSAFPSGLGGNRYFFASASITIPVKAWSRKLIPEVVIFEDEEGEEPFTLAAALKGTVRQAEQSLILEFLKAGQSDIEARKAAKAIVERDIKPAVYFLADKANVFAVKPLLFFEYGALSSTAEGLHDSLGLGVGIQVSVVNARGEIGLVRNVKGSNVGETNLFMRLNFTRMF